MTAILRRAVLAAIHQEDFMRAAFGDDPEVWRTCKAMMPCGVKDVTELGGADKIRALGKEVTTLVSFSGH